jgi:acetyl-CoA acetyltransferase
VKWGCALAELSSLELGTAVTQAALEARGLDPAELDSLVLGWTVPQLGIFYGAPTLSTAIGAPAISGAMVHQACATSVAALKSAARNIQTADAVTVLVVLTDRTSNAPLLVHPQPAARGGAPATGHWLLDSFACDPSTKQSMLATAEKVASLHC